MAVTTLRTLARQRAPVAAGDVTGLRERLRGQLIERADADYDAARAVWNGLIEHRPGLIARCVDAADVAAAVTFARERDLLVSVRGGGHNVAGTAVCDDGLVIDLSEMTDVEVDPGARTVLAGGGTTIGQLDAATQRGALGVPMGVVSETGIAGLTLGGGFGWLRRKYGLSCDSLIGADLVTADGELVSTDTDDELLWGLRGGGGNFGVVTALRYRAYPVGPEVYFAVVLYPEDQLGTALRRFRDWAPTAPDEVSAFAVLWHTPELDAVPARHHHEPGVAFVAMHSGDPVTGERELATLRDFGTPLADLGDTVPYLRAQRFFDADYPAHEQRYYWKGQFLGELSDAALDTMVELNASSPSDLSTVDIWQLGGAVARGSADTAAFGDRSAPYLIGIESNWTAPEMDAAGVAWGREAHQRLAPFAADLQYVNFGGMYEDNAAIVADAFGANLARLRELKSRYDPRNFFRLNHNIVPG
ncbi:MAG: FAD-binding oxidoreductase [Actinocatenispora sp.]